MTGRWLEIPPWLKVPVALAVVVALLQTGALAAMVLDRARHLATGREVVLPVVPVDPRSLFRGDYVILSYGISQAPPPPGPALADRATVYVTIAQRPDETGKPAWTAIATSPKRPAAVGADQIVLQGRKVGRRSGPDGAQILVHYGIESYFVPEGTGRALEDKVRTQDLAAIVAVDGQGRSAIKGLVLDGQVRYDEPLF